MKAKKYNIVAILVLLASLVIADSATTETPVKAVTLFIVRNGDESRTIHKVFLTEEGVKKYILRYKDSHNYESESISLTE